MKNNAPNRRRFLINSAGGALAMAAGLASFPARAATLTIGIVYVGPRGDFGWNESHAVGVQALKGLPDVKVIEAERIPETVAVATTIESMIVQDGATLILGTPRYGSRIPSDAAANTRPSR